MPMLNIDGLKIHYQQSGQGPDVVLIHAFTSNLSVWMFINIMATLGEHFRVTIYDLRGHGNSSAPPTNYTSADMAADLHALHERLGLGPAFLVGHSFGGVVAMHAALLHPEWVRGVILSDSYFPGLSHIEPNMMQAGAWTDLREKLAACDVDIGDTVDFGRLFELVGTFGPEQFEVLKQKMGPAGARWMSQLVQLALTTANHDVFIDGGLTAERIGTVAQPVVALYDEHTAFGATRDYLAKNLPNCRMATVSGAKHLAPLENSEEFVGLVQKYLFEMAGIGTSQQEGCQQTVSG